ncbi:UNVERIFIED_CONTAM: Retrovirus-related Pol polyprotein from transposon RE1 [Sesamum radiatum]|uniref:Retrovirus-related Pol polyprotein from transposon RE1 n=1 Tax=Sesamum radiatum TaxID=300843 RepID=A0AAW2RFZ6_SESRA
MQDEIEALRRKETWELVPKPENSQAVTCKWKKALYGLKQHYVLGMRSYAKNLLDRFGMGESNGIAMPMEPYLKLNKEEGQLLKDEQNFDNSSSPQSPHLDATKRILRYVKGSLDYGLLYKRSNDFKLRGFTDANWAGDTSDRHSTSGYCFNIGLAVVSWCSKKQSIVALSSTKAEYMATTIATQECIWLKRLIGDIYGRVNYAVPIECDNKSAIRLVANLVFHGRTKHVEIHHHFVREKVLNQEVALREFILMTKLPIYLRRL